MATSGSSFTPTFLGREDNVEDNWVPYKGAQLGLISLAPRSSLGRARDWYEIFVSVLVQNTATDFAQLKAALTKSFPVTEMILKFSFTRHSRAGKKNRSISYMKVHKKLRLSMSEEALVDHIFVLLESRVQYYVEVRNPKTTAQLLEVMAKFEERYSCKEMQGSRSSDNVRRRSVGCLMMTSDEEIG
ncbi:uncharacterized protein TNCV_3006371 [Trichonephila clavipes]|nr:uncharacterized protein TNCV_3006371 [Trichonephila clavipes]